MVGSVVGSCLSARKRASLSGVAADPPPPPPAAPPPLTIPQALKAARSVAKRRSSANVFSTFLYPEMNRASRPLIVADWWSRVSRCMERGSAAKTSGSISRDWSSAAVIRFGSIDWIRARSGAALDDVVAVAVALVVFGPLFLLMVLLLVLLPPRKDVSRLAPLCARFADGEADNDRVMAAIPPPLVVIVDPLPLLLNRLLSRNTSARIDGGNSLSTDWSSCDMVGNPSDQSASSFLPLPSLGPASFFFDWLGVGSADRARCCAWNAAVRWILLAAVGLGDLDVR